MDKPRNRTLAGLRRLLDDPDTAVQIVNYTNPDGNDDQFWSFKFNVNYWPRRPVHAEMIRFINAFQVISYMWPTSWTYERTDDGILATRQSSPNGARLTLLIHQPEVLAQQYSDSLTPDRIDDNA